MSKQHAERYTNDELIAMATCTMTAIRQNNPMGTYICVVIGQMTRMHPNTVAQEIQKLANLKR